MMCEVFRECVWEYLEGWLPDRAEFERHGAECPSCAASLEAIVENEKILRHLQTPSAPAELWSRIVRETVREPRGHWSRWAVAAALLVGIGIFALAEFRRASAPLGSIVFEDAEGDLGMFVPSYDDGAAGED